MKHPFIPFKKVLLLIATIIFTTSINSTPDTNNSISSESIGNKTFMVLSDLHYFDPSLLISDGTAFQAYLAHDRKMLQESKAILRAAIDTVKALNPDFLLVSGDLTKDGEKVSHQAVATFFKELEDVGIDVFVTPGNHDINNPYAFAFDGDSKKPVSTITPAEFSLIYANYGYAEATKTDTASLSYMAAYDDLIILSLDVCHYQDIFETAGSLNESTLTWALDRLKEAETANKQVFTLMHHGMLEHYTLQATVMPEYIIENWDSISTILADAGMNVVFTGHSHSQDITNKVTPQGHVMWDIETGSAVTYPVPFRHITLTPEQMLHIEGGSINNVTYNNQLYTNFEAYANAYLLAEFPAQVKQLLISRYELDDFTASLIAPVVTNAFMANYKGDEGEPTTSDQQIIQQMAMFDNANSKLLAAVINSLWTDLAPADWTTTIDLTEKHDPLSANFSFAENENINFEDVNTYFNSENQTLHIQSSQNSLLSITNMSGQTILNARINSGIKKISLAHLPTGVYICKTKTSSETILTKIFIK